MSNNKLHEHKLYISCIEQNNCSGRLASTLFLICEKRILTSIRRERSEKVILSLTRDINHSKLKITKNSETK